MGRLRRLLRTFKPSKPPPGTGSNSAPPQTAASVNPAALAAPVIPPSRASTPGGEQSITTQAGAGAGASDSQNVSKLWQTARSIAEKQLSESERAELRSIVSGSVESAVCAAKDAHAAAAKGRWTYRGKPLAERFARILRGLENYARIGDIAIQHNPETTALVWAAVRFALQVAVNQFEIIDNLEEALETIISRMAECEFYARIYRESLQITLSTPQTTRRFTQDLEGSLPNFYATVLIFSVRVKTYFARGKLLPTLTPFSVKFQPLLDEMREAQTAVRSHADKATMERIKDNSKDLRKMRAVLDDIKSQMVPPDVLHSIHDGVNQILNRPGGQKKGIWPGVGWITSEHYKMIPYCQNSNFTGRGPISQRLLEMLSKPGHGRVALCGLGGVGKTQIALDCVYQKTNGKCHVFWVHGASQATFSRDYHKISSKLGLPVGVSKEDGSLLQVKDWFENESNDWVLVIDNADDPQQYQDSGAGTAKYIPQGSAGTLIITTRSRTVASRLGCKHIEVPKMDLSEAEELLKCLLADSVPITDGDDGIIRDLLPILDYLPLAIAAAATYMRENMTLPSEYLEMLKSTRSNETGLLMENFYDIHREPLEQGMTESVLTTYYINFRRIQELCPLAGDILRFIAFLHRQAIPERLLVESGLEGVRDVLRFRKAMGYLLDFSLIARGTDPKSYDIHRLVHLSIETYTLQDADKWKNRALNTVSELFPYVEYDDWDICSLYLPHALAVVRYSDLSQHTATKLQKNLVSYLYRKGDYRAAEEHLKHSLEMCRRNGEDTLAIENFLGLVYHEQSHYERALEWYGRVLSRTERALGKYHPYTLTTVDNIASVYNSQGEYDEALKLYQRALAGRERILGKGHLDTLTTVHNTASVYNEQGEYNKALEWYGRALAGSEKVLGKGHPSALVTVDCMASVYKNQGQYDKALEWYGRALDGMERVLGRDHPDTLVTVHNMGLVYDNQGECCKAMEWYWRALAGYEKALGKDHLSTLTVVHKMASIYNKQGEYGKALEWFARALAGLERALGKDHFKTVQTAGAIAEVKRKMQDS